MKKSYFLNTILILVLTGCASTKDANPNTSTEIAIATLPSPLPTPTSTATPEVLAYYDFSDPDSWSSLVGDGELKGLSEGIDNGVYKVVHDNFNGYSSAIPVDKQEYTDTTIRVDITPLQDVRNDAVYGVACRGIYYFLITSDGYAGITKASGGRSYFLSGFSLQKADFKLDPTTPTTLRADCVGNTFGLYINDVLITSAYDEDPISSGLVGISVTTSGGRGKTELIFDNFTVVKNTTPVEIQNKEYPSGQILMVDDFSTVRNRWGLGRDIDSNNQLVTEIKIEDNELWFSSHRNRFIKSDPSIAELKDIRITVDATKVGGSDTTGMFGILCYPADYVNTPNQYYLFSIRGDGRAQILHYDNGEYINLSEGQVDLFEGVHQGNSLNTISAECTTTALRMSVNGVQILEVFQDYPGPYRFGLFARSMEEKADIEVYFENLSVSVP